jgi:hypothetical protein
MPFLVPCCLQGSDRQLYADVDDLQERTGVSASTPSCLHARVLAYWLAGWLCSMPQRATVNLKSTADTAAGIPQTTCTRANTPFVALCVACLTFWDRNVSVTNLGVMPQRDVICVTSPTNVTGSTRRTTGAIRS